MEGNHKATPVDASPIDLIPEQPVPTEQPNALQAKENNTRNIPSIKKITER